MGEKTLAIQFEKDTDYRGEKISPNQSIGIKAKIVNN